MASPYSNTTGSAPTGGTPRDTDNTSCLTDSEGDDLGHITKSPLWSCLIAHTPTSHSSLDYQLAKRIYTEHPLGALIADWPIDKAFSQPREVSGVPEAAADQFKDTWRRYKINETIKWLCSDSRVYGASYLYEVSEGKFNVLDPLITSGSLTGPQSLNPFSEEFLRTNNFVVQGRATDKEKGLLLYNGRPNYLVYSNTSYGYAPLSIYYRCLYYLGQYLMSSFTDEQVMRKAGVIVMKRGQQSMTPNRLKLWGDKLARMLIRRSKSGDVISTDPDGDVKTLDLGNVEAALGPARLNMLDSIAHSAGIPAIVLKAQTFTGGFGEGKEESKQIADFVESYRESIEHVFEWIVPKMQTIAWTREWYESFRDGNDEYKEMSYEVAMSQWKTSFRYLWPNYLREPDSEISEKADRAIRANLDIAEFLLRNMDNPEIKAEILQSIVELTSAQSMEILFPVAFDFGIDPEDISSTPTPSLDTPRASLRDEALHNDSVKSREKAKERITRWVREHEIRGMK